MYTRRGFLSRGGIVMGGAIGSIGCLERGSTDPLAPTSGTRPDPRATGSFFPIYDFTRHLADSAFRVENAVPIGQRGHGWEPAGDILPRLVEADVFVHLGIQGFQRWVDDALRVLKDESEVTVVNATADVELLPVDGDDPEHGHDHAHTMQSGTSIVTAIDPDREDVDFEPTALDGARSDSGVRSEITDNNEPRVDPHFWLDPVRASRSVETIGTGLIEANPKNTDRIANNMESYRNRLERLHHRFGRELENRTHDTLVVAGHNSYRYLGERYDIDILSPVGIAPEAEPTFRDLEAIVEIVESKDIEHVLYEASEGDALARQLEREADSVEAIHMITTTASMRRDWHDRGMGYVELMHGVNLPAIETALGVDR